MFNRLKNALFPSTATPRTPAPSAPANGATVHSNPLAECAACKNRGDRLLAEGKLDEAAECYRQATVANPDNGDAYCSLGIVSLQQERYQDAENYLRQAISAEPESAQAYYFLGTALQKQGKLNEAIENFRRALTLKPDAEIIYSELCYALFQTGQREAAKQAIQQGLSVSPNFADFHLFLGNLYCQEKDFDKAIACYLKTLSIQPDSAAAYTNIRQVLQEQTNPDRAIACYRDVLQVNPELADAHFDLGAAYENLGALDNAIDCYRKALALRPDFVEAYNNLGNIYKDQGKPDEAIASYQKALALRPNTPEIHLNFGLTLACYGQLSEAAAALELALKLNPHFADAHYSLGNIYLAQSRANDAIACYRKALEFKPNFANARHAIGCALMAQGRSLDAAASFAQALQLEPGHFTAMALMVHELQKMCVWDDLDAKFKALRQMVHGMAATNEIRPSPLAFLCIPGVTAEEQKLCAEKYSQGEFASLGFFRKNHGFKFKHPPKSKISVGYLSRDFRQHAVSFLMAEVFELHDRSRFQIIAYSYGPDDGSAMRKRVEQAFDKFVDIQGDSYEEAASKIHADGVDILVDLTGHTESCRTEILALRPAPIQVNYLAYPGTMGADFVDFIIADRFTIPPEKTQYYTEKVVWLPDCFQANDSKRARPSAPNRKDCGLPEAGFVFCCFNQTFKITPDMFDVWCRLLMAVPGSTLWLPASNPQAEANLHREAESRGVETARIIMAPMLPRDSHLARLQCADLFLDTLPFNAGTTCSDALWMGLPVLTCAGDAFASRMAGSLLTAIGAPELITYNLDDYYRLALELATDRDKLRAIRDRIIANRDTGPLFDSQRFTRNLEKAYESMLSEQAATSTGVD